MHNKPIPITFILEELNFGGTQKQTLELARHINRELFTPQIWTMRAGEELMEIARKASIAVDILRHDAVLRPFPAAYTLWKTLRERRPRLIHLCTAFPNVWGRLLGRLTHTPCIVASCRGQGNVRLQHERFLWHLAHSLVCDAKSIEDALLALGMPKQNLHYIPNGVDTDFFAPALQQVTAPEILCVGRMVEEKDHATLLKAFTIVQKRLPAARLHLVGDGPLLQQMQERVAVQNMTSSVILHGSSAQVREHMRAAQLFVLSSVSEGTPNALLEAMACGLPVVATRVGGIPDLVQDAVHGVLIQPRDYNALAAAMLRILENPEDAMRMGRAGREHVIQTRSLCAAARQYESVYTSLL